MRRVRQRRLFARRQDGASGTFAMLVSVGAFVVMTGAVFEYSAEQRVPEERTASAELYSAAVRLSDRIFGQTGTGWYQGTYCVGGHIDASALRGDQVRAFGLKSEPCGTRFSASSNNHIDYHKLKSLNEAGLASTANNRTDYEDALSMLGLKDTGLQFRLDGEPLLPPLHGAVAQDSAIRAAYIGDYAYQVVGQQQPGFPVPPCIETSAGCMPPACPNGCTAPTDIYSWVPRNSTLNETLWIDALSGPFDRAPRNASYNHTDMPRDAGGDVFADESLGLQYDLTPLIISGSTGTLDTYNTIVVGAGVSSNQMNEIRTPLRQWVDAGGLLVVFGSDTDLTWTEVPFKAKLKSQAGTSTAPDAEAGLLTQRSTLDWANYDARGRVWEYNSGGNVVFEHVLALNSFDHLALSIPNAFGDGRVVLSAFQPDKMHGSGTACTSQRLTDGACEAMRLLQNAFTLPYSDLYLSFGGIPGPANELHDHTRVVTTYHPGLDATVDIRVSVSVWRDGAARISAAPTQTPSGFPRDYMFQVPSPVLQPTYHNETFLLHSNSQWVRADLEDFNLVASSYMVRVVMKPPGCDDPADWADTAWTLPDPTNTLAPIELDARCDPAGLWSIEIYGQAAALASGSLRVHLSDT